MLELASVESHNPLGHTKEARQVGGQPAQSRGVGDNRAQRQIVPDGAACGQQEEKGDLDPHFPLLGHLPLG